MKTQINLATIDRAPVNTIEMKRKDDKRDFQRNRQPYNQRGGYNNRRDGDGDAGLVKGGMRHQRRDEDFGSWLKEDNEEKIKLKQAAASMKEKLKGDKKEDQKIRLILNVISPDNYEKKFAEIREHLFRGFKTVDECFNEHIEYNEDEHKLTDDNINTHMVELITQNLFKKAQTEKEYCIFYGDLCERIIKLELDLRGLEKVRKGLKNSAFRKKLLEVCKECFEQFFSEEERLRAESDFEKMLKFQDKLFGNIDFVGELYRRLLLPQETLLLIFRELLGLEGERKVDDLNVEGGINLMNKVGKMLEDKMEKQKQKMEQNNEKTNNLVKVYNEIFDQFNHLIRDEIDKVENRVKLLIKNMIANKESGWAKTEKKNQGGPKTKAEVQKEVLKKYESQYGQQMDQRDESQYNQSQNRRGDRDNRYNDDGGRGKGRGQVRGQQQYQEKRGGGGGKNEYSDLTQEKMETKLKHLFDKFIEMEKRETNDDDEEEEEEKNQNDKQFDFPGIFKKVCIGSKPTFKKSQILQFLISQVFELDQEDMTNLLPKFIKGVMGTKEFSPRDIQDGLSRIITLFPDLALDYPQLHQYLYTYVILPIEDCGYKVIQSLNFRIEKKDVVEPTEGDDEDDVDFNGSDCLFKFLATILVNYGNADLEENIKLFEEKFRLKQLVQEKKDKLEDAEETLDEIKQMAKSEKDQATLAAIFE